MTRIVVCMDYILLLYLSRYQEACSGAVGTEEQTACPRRNLLLSACMQQQSSIRNWLHFTCTLVWQPSSANGDDRLRQAIFVLLKVGRHEPAYNDNQEIESIAHRASLAVSLDPRFRSSTRLARSITMPHSSSTIRICISTELRHLYHTASCEQQQGAISSILAVEDFCTK